MDAQQAEHKHMSGLESAGTSARKADPPQKVDEPLEPLEDVLRSRLTTIKEGDNVLLRLPSDTIKAVVASSEG